MLTKADMSKDLTTNFVLTKKLLFQTVQDEMVAAMKDDRSLGPTDLNRFAITLS